MTATSPRRRSSGWIEEPGLGVLLRAIRELRGWSQRELARRAGLSPSAIARIEASDRRPTRVVFDKLATALGVRPLELRHVAATVTDPDDETAVGQAVERLTADGGWAATEVAGEYDRAGSPPAAARAASSASPDETAATMPAGQLRWLFADAVGRDDRGYWIDPAAPAFRPGDDTRDVRVTRLDDGRFMLDVSMLAQRIGQRQPNRHRALTTVHGSDMEQDLHDVYEASVVEIQLPDGETAVVAPQPDGTYSGEFPADYHHVHVITAANPGSLPRTDGENAERNRMLERDLRDAGLTYTRAVGRSPDATWSEDSFAVYDADEKSVLDLARRYDQNALYRWTPGARSVVRTRSSI